MKLSDVCFEMHQGINTVADKVKYYECGTPILQSKNITNGILDLEDVRFVDKNDYNKYKERYIPHKGNILLSNIGTIGKSLLIDEEKDFLIAWNIFLIKVNESKINSKFLNFYFQYLDMSNYYNKYLTGGTVKFINKKTMENIEIPNISLANQIKIADEIEKVQKMINIREKQIKKLDELIKSQFVEMFENEKYPKRILSELTDKITDGSHNPPTGIAENQGYMMLSSQNIINNSINYDNVRYLKKEDFEKENRRTDLQKGDVLLTIVGTVGRTAIMTEESNIVLQRSVAVIKPNKEINSAYLVGALNSESVINQLNKGAKGVAQKGIYLNDLKKIIIKVPPIELQNQFADIVKQIDKQKFEIQKSLEEMQKLQESLMNKYFGD